MTPEPQEGEVNRWTIREPQVNQPQYTQPAADKGRYMTIAEYSAAHPDYPVRALQNFAANGMPVDPRGKVDFIYENEATAWIESHVTPKTIFVIKRES